MAAPADLPPSRPPVAAAARDLDDAEFAVLGELLAGIPEPLEPLALDEADGYVAGIAVQPRAIAEDEWLRFVWDAGGHRWGEAAPSDERRRAGALLVRREQAIRRSLAEFAGFDPWIADPAADEDPIASTIAPWVGGFIAALDLFPPSFPAAEADRAEAACARLARYLEESIVDRPASVDAAVADVVAAVFECYQIAERQRYHVATERREAPRVGRNDPCPCGSGRKFKHCHGQAG